METNERQTEIVIFTHNITASHFYNKHLNIKVLYKCIIIHSFISHPNEIQMNKIKSHPEMQHIKKVKYAANTVSV